MAITVAPWWCFPHRSAANVGPAISFNEIIILACSSTGIPDAARDERIVLSSSLVPKTKEHFLSCTSMVKSTCSLLSPTRMNTESEKPGMASRSCRDRALVVNIGHNGGLSDFWMSEVKSYDLSPFPEGTVEPFYLLGGAPGTCNVSSFIGTGEKTVHGRVGCIQSTTNLGGVSK